MEMRGISPLPLAPAESLPCFCRMQNPLVVGSLRMLRRATLCLSRARAESTSNAPSKSYKRPRPDRRANEIENFARYDAACCACMRHPDSHSTKGLQLSDSCVD